MRLIDADALLKSIRMEQEAVGADLSVEAIEAWIELRAERASYVPCGECAVPHNEWTGCPKLGGKIPPDNYSCGQGERI